MMQGNSPFDIPYCFLPFRSVQRIIPSNKYMDVIVTVIV